MFSRLIGFREHWKNINALTAGAVRLNLTGQCRQFTALRFSLMLVGLLNLPSKKRDEPDLCHRSYI